MRSFRCSRYSFVLQPGLAGLQAAIHAPSNVQGVQLINISLRGLHVKRQNAVQRPLIAAFQRVLRDTQLGQAFFGNVATPQVSLRHGLHCMGCCRVCMVLQMTIAAHDWCRKCMFAESRATTQACGFQ